MKFAVVTFPGFLALIIFLLAASLETAHFELMKHLTSAAGPAPVADAEPEASAPTD